MYFFVPYNISEIQKGIQAGHASLEYARLFGDTPEFKYFVQSQKTWVILNGGTTMDADVRGNRGTMQEIEEMLWGGGIPYTSFNEPDLNNALTALCFLAPEQVYDREIYPDLPPCGENEKYGFEAIEAWVKGLGGRKNVFLRQLITGKHLA